MWNNDIASHHHKIVHTYSRPLSPSVGLLTNAEIRSDFPALIQELPYEVALPNAHCAPRDV
ncbi:hypothetical protein RRF57_009757 [Xylaria bambusicola]|uniref:Uncharacterized protein n=1 Tax=Xylaria bambusicola TaxID=326684 RepID=A0AAN7ZC56_9PEZI